MQTGVDLLVCVEVGNLSSEQHQLAEEQGRAGQDSAGLTMAGQRHKCRQVGREAGKIVDFHSDFPKFLMHMHYVPGS